MQEVVGIEYKHGSKIYYFSPNGLDLRVGDKVIVESSQGVSVGTVSEGKHFVENKDIEEPLKAVSRLATEKDLKKLEMLKEKAKSQLPIIEECIKECKLSMNLVEVEYAFDESKIVITYTSDNRVDFRELLKLLASKLKTRIEMRQIGTRDEVKMIGGLGLCGMPCCCTRFLKEPERVNVKMVKLQSLSMNASKTGGLCGRMMCCLAYEEKCYKELSAFLPEVNKKVKTPDGEGVVASLDILKQRVNVKFVTETGTKIKNYSVDDIEYEGKVKRAKDDAEIEYQKLKDTKDEESELLKQTSPISAKQNFDQQKVSKPNIIDKSKETNKNSAEQKQNNLIPNLSENAQVIIDHGENRADGDQKQKNKHKNKYYRFHKKNHKKENKTNGIQN